MKYFAVATLFVAGILAAPVANPAIARDAEAEGLNIGYGSLPSYGLKKKDADAEAEGLNIGYGSLPSYGLKKKDADAEAEGLNIGYGSLPSYGLKEKRDSEA